VSDSILNSVKKILGIAEDYTAFDVDILMHINTVFATLNQVGVGPVEGFMIEDDTSTWDAFLGTDLRRNNVKTYVYLRVRMLFDPPATSYLIDALKEQYKELEWRLNVYREETAWVDPDPGELVEDGVLDGGPP
jgi:hypothetical protein